MKYQIKAMARLSGKGGVSKKIDIVVPHGVYDRIVRVAKDSGAAINPKTGVPTLSPVVLRLVLEGLEVVEDDPQKLTAVLPADLNQVEVRSLIAEAVKPILARIEALEASPKRSK